MSRDSKAKDEVETLCEKTFLPIVLQISPFWLTTVSFDKNDFVHWVTKNVTSWQSKNGFFRAYRFINIFWCLAELAVQNCIFRPWRSKIWESVFWKGSFMNFFKSTLMSLFEVVTCFVVKKSLFVLYDAKICYSWLTVQLFCRAWLLIFFVLCGSILYRAWRSKNHSTKQSQIIQQGNLTTQNWFKTTLWENWFFLSALQNAIFSLPYACRENSTFSHFVIKNTMFIHCYKENSWGSNFT